jgi:hypothetical protein
MKTFWCKNQENPSDRISHAWAPLKRQDFLHVLEKLTFFDPDMEPEQEP